MNGHINASIGILTYFSSHKHLAMLGSSNNLNACLTSLAAVDDDFDLINAVVVLRKLGCLFLSVRFDGFRYFNMFTTDCEKQNDSP